MATANNIGQEEKITALYCCLSQDDGSEGESNSIANQELREHRRRPTATGRKSLFSGLVYCPDCGAKLHSCAAKSLRRNQEFFRCSNYKDGKRSKCTIHFIRNVVLEKIVLEAVSDLADFVRIYEPVFLYLIARREQDNRTGNLKELKDNLETWKKRMKAIDKAISTLFEANMEGKISDDRFMKMTADYESEQKELESMVSRAEKDLKEAEQNKVDLRLLLKALREYSEIKELTPALVNKLIQRIEVHNNDKSSGHCHVQVDIYFTGIGMMNLPTEHELMKLMEEYQSEHKSLNTTE